MHDSYIYEFLVIYDVNECYSLCYVLRNVKGNLGFYYVVLYLGFNL
jgi:hypothetical protein